MDFFSFSPFFFQGTIGHVAHGKSTVVKAISGVQVCGFFVFTACNFPFSGMLGTYFSLLYGDLCLS